MSATATCCCKSEIRKWFSIFLKWLDADEQPSQVLRKSWRLAVFAKTQKMIDIWWSKRNAAMLDRDRLVSYCLDQYWLTCIVRLRKSRYWWPWMFGLCHEHVQEKGKATANFDSINAFLHSLLAPHLASAHSLVQAQKAKKEIDRIALLSCSLATNQRTTEAGSWFQENSIIAALINLFSPTNIYIYWD